MGYRHGLMATKILKETDSEEGFDRVMDFLEPEAFIEFLKSMAWDFPQTLSFLDGCYKFAAKKHKEFDT